MALTRECRLPADVLGLAPFNRGLRIRSNAAGKRAAPLRPGVRLQLVAFGIRRLARCPRYHENPDEQRHERPFQRRSQSMDHTRTCAERNVLVSGALQKISHFFFVEAEAASASRSCVAACGETCTPSRFVTPSGATRNSASSFGSD